MTSTYVIGFKITQFHTQMNQTRVHVSKCVATPESSEAHILERVLVEKITSRDAMRLLGVEPVVMGFPVKQAPSSATVGRRLAAIYQETYGPYRVSAFRKQMQNLSAKAVSERRKDVAKLYQSYAVASANLVVRTILAEYLPQKQHGAIRITGRMGDLNSNIGYARREVAKYANSDESANLEILKKWPLPSDFVARTLARVQADVKRGDLKTTQFQQLEALLPKQPGKI